MLIDSNIIIYSTQPDHVELRNFIAEHTPAVSAVSVIEVLGYQKLSEGDRAKFEAFFDAAAVLPLDNEVVRKAVRLRQLRRMTLGISALAGSKAIRCRV